MALIAGDLIDRARDRHPGFDPNRQSPAVALRALSDYAKRLHGKITALDPSLVKTAIEVALPLADFDAGYTFADTVRLVQEVYGHPPANLGELMARPVPIHVIDESQRSVPNLPRAAVWQIGQTLFLRPPASRWQDLASLTVWVVTRPVALATLRDTVPLPDAAEQACIEQVAYTFAKRAAASQLGAGSTGALSLAALQIFADDAAKAEADLLNELVVNVGVREFVTEDVYRP